MALPNPTHRILITLLVALLVLFMLMSRSVFNSTSVCGDCGVLRYTTEWQIPFTSTVYWTTHSYSDLKLSLVAKRNGLAPIQPHHWLCVEGNGEGSFAIGEGSEVLINLQAGYVADFLDCACKCGEKQFARAWLKLLLDPTTSNAQNAHFAIPEIPKGELSN